MLSWLSYFKNIMIHVKEKAQLQQRPHNVSVTPVYQFVIEARFVKNILLMQINKDVGSWLFVSVLFLGIFSILFKVLF